jgi:hypothetical protein
MANMHNIPLEILESILNNLLEYTHQNNERFSTLTPTSKRSILSARAVWGAYRTYYPLRQLFVRVLEETPFVVSGPLDERGWISGLDALSLSEYARDLTTLSFCPMVFDGQLHATKWPANTFETLVIAVSSSIFAITPFLVRTSRVVGSKTTATTCMYGIHQQIAFLVKSI